MLGWYLMILQEVAGGAVVATAGQGNGDGATRLKVTLMLAIFLLTLPPVPQGHWRNLGNW
jgi:hypothetical protein